MIFGRTDLRISLSKAKLRAEADFGVRFAVARQNPRQISKKHNYPSENFAEKKKCRQEVKCRESSETRFPKVSHRSEPSSGGKRTNEKTIFSSKQFWRRKRKRRESSETRFPKVWRLCGPCLKVNGRPKFPNKPKFTNRLFLTI